MGPWKHQNTIKAIESSTALLRLFQGQFIPGLLQTPEYATAVFSLPPALPEETRARTVAARLERQATLYEDGRSFRFVICEHVLRWLVCEPAVMATQLDRVVSVSRLPNVSIGVVPLTGRMRPDPVNAGTIKQWCVDYWEEANPYSMGGSYVNFMGEVEDQGRVRATYRDHYDRLAQVKRTYDPGNLFHANQNIRPAQLS
ncbi:Scr1 family TA system antitoxin-like transcriptional regulator [Streptomyces sp. NBC_00443]